MCSILENARNHVRACWVENENLKPQALHIYSKAAFYNVPNTENNLYDALPRVCRDLVTLGREPL